MLQAQKLESVTIKTNRKIQYTEKSLQAKLHVNTAAAEQKYFDGTIQCRNQKKIYHFKI